MPRKLLQVKIIPNSRQNIIVDRGNDSLKIKLTAPAVDGKANKALIEFLSDHFKISKNRIKIIKGEKAREKIIELQN